MSHTLTTLNSGVFQVNSTGEVKIDYLYDGGFNKGQLAIFSLAGMENLMPGSLEFNLEAAKRALSSSTQGYVVINDNSDRARFSDVLTWEGNFNGGEYQGQKTFQLQANSTFAMMLISQGTIAQFLNNPNGSSQPLFSFANLSSSTGNIPQMVDITGKGNTFGWEDIRSATVSDRDYNDLVVQVSGATARATAIDGVISASRDWRNTVVGRDLINYANRLQLEKGIFEVNPTGQVKFDYLFDGGWFEGELGIFNLKGMERYEVGSVEFIKEASRRALSNSTEGRVVIQDAREGAKFSSSFSWENNFNKGNYKGVKSFTFNPGDQFAFMMVRNATIENLYHTSDSQNVLAKSPWFSIQNPHVSTDLSQFVAIDNHGTFGFEDIQATNADPNLDYNDIVFQVQGLTGSAEILDSKIDSSRDWRNSTLGINLLAYTARTQYSSGIFQVGKTGKLEYDFLFDGGWFQGELGVFSLAGLDQYTPGSLEFIKEAAKRALSNTTQGRILVKDASEGARFTQAMSWENNFNSGTYKGVRSIALTPGDEVAFMLIQHTNFQEIFNTPSKISQWGKLPIFSIPELNPGGTPPNQFVAVDDNGTFAFEDVRVDWGTSDQDYNDLIFQVKGVKGFAQSIDQAFNPERDWRKSSSGNSLLTYANRSFFDEGVLIASESGRVTVNYLYDGGTRQGELGIFSLMGMDSYEIGSRSFMQEALRRATSNSLQGRVIVNENIEGAKLDYTHDILWEGDYNSGKYVGEKVLQLTPGVAFGLVYSSNGLTDELLNPNGPSPEKLFFSMSKSNLQQTDQITEVLSSGTISSTTSSTIPAQSIQGLQAYNTVLSTQAGSTNEPIALKIEYGQDFNGDNLQDIKVSLRIVESAIDPVMGTEDMIGVAFDIGDDRLISILGLTIDNIFTSPNLGSPILNQNPVFGTNFLLGQNQINPPPGNFLGINVSGDPSLVLTPYDGIVKFGNGGLGTDGYVRQSSFVIAGNRDITGTLVTQILNGTDWYVRLQSTDGGGGSAKTVGVIGNIEAVNAEPVTILSLEDVHLNYGSNRDYNDIVVAFTGVQSVGFTPIDDVIQSDRNWQNTLVGQEILHFLG